MDASNPLGVTDLSSQLERAAKSMRNTPQKNRRYIKIETDKSGQVTSVSTVRKRSAASSAKEVTRAVEKTLAASQTLRGESIIQLHYSLDKIKRAKAYRPSRLPRQERKIDKLSQDLLGRALGGEGKLKKKLALAYQHRAASLAKGIYEAATASERKEQAPRARKALCERLKVEEPLAEHAKKIATKIAAGSDSVLELLFEATEGNPDDTLWESVMKTALLHGDTATVRKMVARKEGLPYNTPKARRASKKWAQMRMAELGFGTTSQVPNPRLPDKDTVVDKEIFMMHLSLWLMAGGKPNAVTSDKVRLLGAAAEAGQERAVDLLLRRGADVKLADKDAYGQTPLRRAARSPNGTEAAKRLIEAGALRWEDSILDDNSDNAFEAAVRAGNTDLAWALITAPNGRRLFNVSMNPFQLIRPQKGPVTDSKELVLAIILRYENTGERQGEQVTRNLAKLEEQARAQKPPAEKTLEAIQLFKQANGFDTDTPIRGQKEKISAMKGKNTKTAKLLKKKDNKLYREIARLLPYNP